MGHIGEQGDHACLSQPRASTAQTRHWVLVSLLLHLALGESVLPSVAP